MQGPILELVVVRDIEDTIRVSISDISSANSRYNIYGFTQVFPS